MVFKRINAVLDVALDVFSRPYVKRDFITVTRSWDRFPLSTKREVRNLSLKVTRGYTDNSGLEDRQVMDDASEVESTEGSEVVSTEDSELESTEDYEVESAEDIAPVLE